MQRPWAGSWSVTVKGTVAGAGSVLGSAREQRRLVEGLVPEVAGGASKVRRGAICLCVHRAWM